MVGAEQCDVRCYRPAYGVGWNETGRDFFIERSEWRAKTTCLVRVDLPGGLASCARTLARFVCVCVCVSVHRRLQRVREGLGAGWKAGWSERHV